MSNKKIINHLKTLREKHKDEDSVRVLAKSKNATVNSLRLLHANFAHKIAVCESPDTDVRVHNVYFPLYEATATLILAADRAFKTGFNDSLENRAALTMVKKQIADISDAARRMHYVPGYAYADRIKEHNEMQADICVLRDIVNDLLA